MDHHIGICVDLVVFNIGYAQLSSYIFFLSIKLFLDMKIIHINIEKKLEFSLMTYCHGIVKIKYVISLFVYSVGLTLTT